MNGPPIYVSSKRSHIQLWNSFRNRGHRIISSWIDLEDAINIEEIGKTYWPKWLAEASAAEYLIFYCTRGEINHCESLLEMAACLTGGGIVLHVGVSATMKTGDGEMASFTYHPRWLRISDLETAFTLAASRSPALG